MDSSSRFALHTLSSRGHLQSKLLACLAHMVSYISPELQCCPACPSCPWPSIQFAILIKLPCIWAPPKSALYLSSYPSVCGSCCLILDLCIIYVYVEREIQIFFLNRKLLKVFGHGSEIVHSVWWTRTELAWGQRDQLNSVRKYNNLKL